MTVGKKWQRENLKNNQHLYNDLLLSQEPHLCHPCSYVLTFCARHLQRIPASLLMHSTSFANFHPSVLFHMVCTLTRKIQDIALHNDFLCSHFSPQLHFKRSTKFRAAASCLLKTFYPIIYSISKLYGVTLQDYSFKKGCT